MQELVGPKPAILSSGRVFYVSAGEKVVLPCTVHHKGSLVRLWKQGTRVIFADDMRVRRDSRYSLTEAGDLIIDGFDESDHGDYECQLETDTDHAIFIRHSLKEAVAPSVRLEPVSWQVVMEEVSGDLSVRC